ncbi:hypothetical protein CEXT_572041 [Caerostris extrusa]|uniref:Uncharacterized protein n=1 Tax=Caerostris extrusa TaxID=172846 RepID=A0AAV4TTH3_CAEEX|nr:hypothetical protein CEXT_572041 [Caerostris extrusa]
MDVGHRFMEKGRNGYNSINLCIRPPKFLVVYRVFHLNSMSRSIEYCGNACVWAPPSTSGLERIHFLKLMVPESQSPFPDSVTLLRNFLGVQQTPWEERGTGCAAKRDAPSLREDEPLPWTAGYRDIRYV